jgi:hypothetical protein
VCWLKHMTVVWCAGRAPLSEGVFVVWSAVKICLQLLIRELRGTAGADLITPTVCNQHTLPAGTDRLLKAGLHVVTLAQACNGVVHSCLVQGLWPARPRLGARVP